MATGTITLPALKEPGYDLSFRIALSFIIIGTVAFVITNTATDRFASSKFLFIYFCGLSILLSFKYLRSSIYLISFIIPLEQAISNWGGGRFNTLAYVLIFLAFVAILKSKEAADYIYFSKLEIVFLLFIIWTAYTVTWSLHKLIGIGNTLYHIGGFLIIYLLVREIRDKNGLINVIKFYLMGSLLMTYALYTTFKPGSATIKKAEGEIIQNALGLGTNIDPEQYARGATVAIFLSLFLYEYLNKSKFKFIYIIMAVFFGISVVLTLNRSSQLALLIGSISYFLFSPSFTAKAKKVFFISFLVFLMGYFAWKINAPAIKERLELTEGFYTQKDWKKLTAGRSFLWKQSIEIFKDNPVIGIGLGGFGIKFWQKTGYLPRVNHNAYLKFATETGIIGLSLFLMLLYLLGVTAIKIVKYRHISLALFLSFVFKIGTHEMLRNKEYWFSMAIILIIYYLGRRKKL